MNVIFSVKKVFGGKSLIELDSAMHELQILATAKNSFTHLVTAASWVGNLTRPGLGIYLARGVDLTSGYVTMPEDLLRRSLVMDKTCSC